MMDNSMESEPAQALPSLAKRVPVATGGCFVKFDVVRRAQNTRHAKIRRDHSDVFMISRATLFAKEGFGSIPLHFFVF